MKKGMTNGYRTWLLIDRTAIQKNFGVFRKLIAKETKLMAVVKSNAYGHSLIDFSREAEKNHADWLGVDSIVEALTLRREGIKVPILVLGYTLPERFADAVANGISISVSNSETLMAIGQANFSKPISIHIKVDTGMHRQGFLPEAEKTLLTVLKKLSSHVRVEGLFTHFAAAKNPSFPAYTNGQIEEFKTWRAAFFDAGFAPLCHAAATAGAMLFPEAHFDMVRIGIGLYGLWPAREVEAYFEDRLSLSPALAWKTVIAEVKKLPKGSKIGYDGTEMLEKDSVIAVCPVGYWHGYPRALSSIGHVLVGGKKCRVVGRVSMDMLTIDVTAVPTAKMGTEVILLGVSGKEEISAEYLSSIQDMSWYELITRINPLIKRIYN